MRIEARTRPGAPGRDGFALIVSFSLLAVVLLVTVALASMVRVHTQAASAEGEAARGRQSAELALALALGQLQRSLGRDEAVSAPDPAAPPGERRWTRSYGGPSGALPLVTDAPGGEASVPFPSNPTGATKAPVKSLPGGLPPIAWWTEDQGLKASLALPDRSGDLTSVFPEGSEVFRQIQSRRPGAEALLPDWDPDADAPRVLDRVTGLEELVLLGAGDRDALAALGPDATARAFGLLTRPGGGLRRNLSGGTEGLADTPLLTPGGREALDSFLDPGAVGWDPASVAEGIPPLYPVPPGSTGAPDDGDWVRSVLPLVTEMKIYIGVFNEGRDGAHRLRYHAGFQLWNPYGFPIDVFNRLYAREDSRGNGLFFANLTGLPRLRVSNLAPDGSVKASFTVDQDPFPAIKNANTTNHPRETSINAAINLETSRFLRRTRAYLEPGEIYHSMDPDEDTEADGHSRLLTNTAADTWWYEGASNRPGAVLPEKSYGAGDRIRLESVDAAGDPAGTSLTLTLKRYQGDLKKKTRPENYPGPTAIQYRNIPFEAFDFILSGAEYHRNQSKYYNRSAFRYAYYFRLNADDPAVLEKLAERIDPRNPVLDFADPEVRDLFEITANPRAAQFASTEFSGIDDSENPFWDTGFNTGRDSHGSFQLFDFPTRPPVSFAALRHLPVRGERPFLVGAPNAAGRNRIFDDYFLTGAGSAGAEWTGWGAGDPLPVLPNLRLRWLEDHFPAAGFARPTSPAELAALAREPDIAAVLVVEGAFNVNSTSAEAWLALLTNNLQAWENRDGDAVALERVFFRRPFQAAAPLISEAPYRDDASLAAGSLSLKERKNTWYEQPFRFLGPPPEGGPEGEPLAVLADEIAQRVADRIEGDGPFLSVEEFLDEGLLADAVDASGLNDDYPRAAAQYLTQGDLVEALAPVLFARSDTFRIHVRTGPADQPASGGLVATAVRLPAYVDPSDGPVADSGLSPANALFGRAFRIIDIRYF